MTTSEGIALRKFQFLQEIAAGGFGSVYLAKLFPVSGEPQIVAIKMLHRRWSDNAEIASRMRDEARLLACLRHENIVEVLDYAVIDGRSAVVMEVLEAVDLRVLLDHRIPTGDLVPLAAALQIGAAVARALDAAYNRRPPGGGRPLRVIHRDIKPSNIMVDATGRVKVLDFGVARADFEAREARTAELAFGSLEYMPPERLFFEPESAASDVYSLGTALFELLALEKLGKAKLRQSEQEKFLAERFAVLAKRHPIPSDELHRDVLQCLGAMLAFDESQRPSATELASHLEGLASRATALGTEGVKAWAAAVVPPLIATSRARSQGEGTLIGRTLTEDPMPAPASRPRAPVDPNDIAEEDADLLELDDSDHSIGPLPALDADDTQAEEAETALHTDLMARAREELVEGILHDPDALDDTAWTALEQQTLRALGNTRVGETVAPTLRTPLDRNVPLPNTSLAPGGPGAPRPGSWAPEAETVVVPLAEAETVLQAPLYLMDGGSPEGPPRPAPPPPPPPPVSPNPASRRRTSLPPGAGSRDAPPAPAGPALRPVHLVAGAMLMLGIGVMLGSAIAVSGVGIAAISLPWPQPSTAAPARPAAVVPPLEPARTADRGGGPGLEVRSMLPDTRRVLVRCDGASATGTDRVRLAGDRFAECTVTAIDGKRRRRTAILADLEPRTYVCFGEGAEDRCR